MENRTNQKICLIASLFLLLLGPALVAADVIYVDAGAAGADNGSSWPDAYLYLQDALDLAISGDEIWVAEATYRPTGPGGDRTATFQLISGVALYGGFPSGGGNWADRDPIAYETILSGDLNGDDGLDFANNAENSYHVVTGSGTDATAILNGFTITAGNANGVQFYDKDGGGMYNDDSSPTLTDCTFSNNWAYSGGGGMYNRYSSPTLTNCTFSDNSADEAGGMYNYSNSSPTLTNCTFTGNRADLGAGMFNRDNSSPTLTNCAFTRNKAAVAQGGGMANMFNSSSTLTNCIFSGNYATSYGGGMYNYESNPILTNCTLSSNLATSAGGGMYNSWDSSPTLTNCILWANSDSGGMDESAQVHTNSGTPVVNYSCIQGTWTGSGSNNIDDDPLFVRNPDDGGDGWGDWGQRRFRRPPPHGWLALHRCRRQRCSSARCL
jgi:hypothetical protein